MLRTGSCWELGAKFTVSFRPRFVYLEVDGSGPRKCESTRDNSQFANLTAFLFLAYCLVYIMILL
jgi:hypothetical protein